MHDITNGSKSEEAMWSGTAYSLILMSVYLSSANDVLSCQPPRLCTSSLDSATETGELSCKV